MPPQLVQVGGDAVGALDALQARPLARSESTRPEPTAASTWNHAPRSAARGRRARRAGRSRRGRSCPAVPTIAITCSPSIAASSASSDSAPVRVGRDADHGLGAEPEQRGRAADAVVRGRGGDDPPVVGRQPVAAHVLARAVARQQQPEQVRGRPAHRHHARAARAEPVLAREPARRARPPRTSPAGEASKASIDWLVTPTASSAAAAGDQRRGVQVRDACAGRRAGCRRRGSARGPRGPARAARPRAGSGSSASRGGVELLGGERRARAGQRARAAASASTTASAAARSASWVRGSAVTNSSPSRRILSACGPRGRCAARR